MNIWQKHMITGLQFARVRAVEADFIKDLVKAKDRAERGLGGSLSPGQDAYLIKLAYRYRGQISAGIAPPSETIAAKDHRRITRAMCERIEKERLEREAQEEKERKEAQKAEITGADVFQALKSVGPDGFFSSADGMTGAVIDGKFDLERVARILMGKES